MNAPLPVVAIVGRPNVGKSTLFNRIVRGRQAIVEDEPGVTRDRLYRESEWGGYGFMVVDTGGLEVNPDDDIRRQVQLQTARAVAEADVVLLVVDARSSLTAADYASVEALRRLGGQIILVANKVDHPNHLPDVADLYGLGLGEPIAVSAEHGQNIGDLLDRVIALLPQQEQQEFDPDVPRVAVVGKPNVGKSSLVNALAAEERVIVAGEPGTTRDAIDIKLRIDGREMVFIDTAGLRRKARVEDGVERYGVLRSLRAIQRSTVVVLMLDATDKVAVQDQRIAGYVRRESRPMILALNKWDLVDAEQRDEYLQHLDERLDFASYAPRLPLSALTGFNVDQLPALVMRVCEVAELRVPTGVLNRALEDAIYSNPPPARKGRRLNVLYVTQVGVRPPEFAFFVNDPELVHFSYKRYLENEWRRRFGFEGSPLVLHFRPRSGGDRGE